MKHPLLEQMRAARQRREDEVTAPYKAELTAAGSVIQSLRASLRRLESVFGNEVGKRLSYITAEEISMKVRELVFEQVAKTRGERKPVKVVIPPHLYMFMDQKSLESEILRQYVRETLPALHLDANPDPMRSVTVLDIRIPPLGMRHQVLN
jgi:hypothetical protein